MERVKVSLPANFQFSTILPVRITDLNYGGHVGNNQYLVYAHEAREQYLKYYGYSEMNIEGVSLIMADASIEFKHELKYGDTVKISVAAANFDRLGFDLFYLFEALSRDKTTIAAKVKTGMLCFDYQQQKMVSVPAAITERLHRIF